MFEGIDFSEAVPVSPPELRGWWAIQLKEGNEYTYPDMFNGKEVKDKNTGETVMRSHTTHPKCLYFKQGDEAGTLVMFPDKARAKAGIERFKAGEYDAEARIMDGNNPVALPPETGQKTAKAAK